MITLRLAYPTVYTTVAQAPGLGDFLRGCITMAHHSRERGWGFELDFAGHPIGRYQSPAAPALAPPEPVAEFFEKRATLVYRWMDELTPGASSRMCTNLLPHESRIDAGVCTLVREQLRFAPAIVDAAAGVHRQVSDSDFAVVHVRMADEDFHTHKPAAAALLQRMESELVPRWGRRLAVLSNNAHVKRSLSERFGLPLIETTPTHLGETDDAEGVRDTLVDFALLGRATHIYSHSAYHWKSGFSHWAARLYGVPYETVVPPPVVRASPLKSAAKWLRDHCDPGY